jgi:predicted double-glycine peptidase
MIRLFEEYSSDVEISLIRNDEDKQSAIDIIDETFKKYGGFRTISGSADFDSSLVLKKDGVVVGTYILGTHPMHIVGNLKHYLGLKGIEGVALAVKPEFRGSGYGNMLKDYSVKNTKADYIWGMQLRDLKNINDWVKRRRIVFSSGAMFITLQDINDKFPHLPQTTGINCGPTSLKILLNYYRSSVSPTIDELTEIMETDYEFGTTDIRMKKGLVHCGLNHKQIVTDDTNALPLLKNYVKNDRKILLRTLTRGVKHWVVVYDYQNDKFLVSDPWLGKIKYNEEQIYSIWKPRNFDGFVVYGEEDSKNIDNIVKIY